MQDYLIVKGKIDPIERENTLEGYKPSEWQKLDRIVCATIQMHLLESVYFTVQSCSTTFKLLKTLSDNYEKKVTATKIYLIRRLYNFRMKESDSVQTHLNEYKSVNSQISAQGTTIEDELRAMLLTTRTPQQGRHHAPIKSRLHPQTLLLRHQFYEHCQYGKQVAASTNLSTERIEPTRFGPLRCLWPDATLVSRRCFVLCQFH